MLHQLKASETKFDRIALRRRNRHVFIVARVSGCLPARASDTLFNLQVRPQGFLTTTSTFNYFLVCKSFCHVGNTANFQLRNGTVFPFARRVMKNNENNEKDHIMKKKFFTSQ